MAYTTINKSTDYFNTKLYTGNGGTNAITGVNHRPDWTWIKQRNGTGNHFAFDAVRGVNKPIHPNLTNAQSTQSDTLMSFDSDGFTLGSDTNNGEINSSGNTFASWNWKAGTGQGSSNTDGSINTTYTSVNTTAGFSISQYTGNSTNGATVGHGLGAVPEMLIGKDLSDTSGWGVWHKDLTNAGYRLNLSTTDAQSDDTALFGGSSRTAPTSSVFTLGSGGGLNGSNANIMYAFTSIKGYSKFGSYTGNGNADGTFVYTGFAVSLIMTKCNTAAGNWHIHDSKRPSYNQNNLSLRPNKPNIECPDCSSFDLLSNGFKCKDTGDGNGSGKGFIYMAFAEAPLVGTNNVPCTAR